MHEAAAAAVGAISPPLELEADVAPCCGAKHGTVAGCRRSADGAAGCTATALLLAPPAPAAARPRPAVLTGKWVCDGCGGAHRRAARDGEGGCALGADEWRNGRREAGACAIVEGPKSQGVEVATVASDEGSVR